MLHSRHEMQCNHLHSHGSLQPHSRTQDAPPLEGGKGSRRMSTAAPPPGLDAQGRGGSCTGLEVPGSLRS